MIPSSLLRQRITVEPYLGDSGYGPRYGDPVPNQPARVEGKRRSIRRPNGTEVISTASITVRPTVDIPVLSRVTAPHPVTGAADTFEVLEVLVGQGLTRPAYLEVLVG